MKFRILVKNEKSDEGWWESYDKPEVKTLEAATKTGMEYVEFYNSTLRPRELPRTFVKAEMLGESTEHSWVKMSNATVSDHLGVYDVMQCSVCGAKGKRFGLASSTRVDSKYRKYRNCPGKRVA